MQNNVSESTDDQIQDECTEREYSLTFVQKCKQMTKIALPAALSMFLNNAQSFVNVIFVSRCAHQTDGTEIAGIGMGIMVCNLFVMAPSFGFNSAIETFVSQALGLSQLGLCGDYLNRARVIFTCYFLLVLSLLLAASRILILVGQNKEASEYAQLYIHWYLPGLYLAGLIDGQRRFLNCLELSDVPFKIQVLGNVVHAGLCYLFIVVAAQGVKGAAIATSLANAFILLSLLIYSWRIEQIKEAVFLPNWRSFTGLWDYLALGLPAAFMLCFDFWAFDLMTLFAGLIDKKTQAAQIFLININDTLFCLSIGIANAASTLIGQKIGAGNLKEAKEYERATIIVSISLLTLLYAPLFASRELIVVALTGVKAVQSKLRGAWYTFLWCNICDQYQGVQ